MGGGKSVSQRRPKSIYTFRLREQQEGGERDWEMRLGATADWVRFGCAFFSPSPPGRGMTVLSMPLVAARVGSTNFSLIIFTTFSCVFFRCFPHRIFLVVFMLFHLRVKFSDKQHAPQWEGGAGEGVCHLTALTEHQREGRGRGGGDKMAADESLAGKSTIFNCLRLSVP